MNIYSRPAYPVQREGTLLVVGSAPCLYEDLDRAYDLREYTDIMALNEAGGAIPSIDYLYAGHYNRAPLFMKYRQDKFPKSQPYEVHACWMPNRVMIPGIDYWWVNASSQGTSAFTAARIGRAMGYDEIILCGCPLDGSGYFNPDETHKHTPQDPRVGTDQRTMENYQKRFAHLALSDGDKIYSMSGFTKEALGAPSPNHRNRQVS